eukprot:TRINITY_DN30380_c0_g1_i1.p1 TRINITY_DN30380_c0_g1~~TRINITY_DN30380_c0_g1_i1.p1  ORF type:complete len:451 (-),score=54.10 TRINITY_DN30380_c0_g1_i1:53-1405(-)
MPGASGVTYHCPIISDCPWRSDEQLRAQAKTLRIHRDGFKAPSRGSFTSKATLARSGGRSLSQSFVGTTKSSPGETAVAFFAGRSLSSMALSSSAGRGSTVDLPSDHSFELPVRTSAGPLCKLKLSDGATVGDAKKALSRVTGLPLPHLKLERGIENRSALDEDFSTLRNSEDVADALPLLLTATHSTVPENALWALLRQSLGADGANRKGNRDAAGAVKPFDGAIATSLPSAGFPLDFNKAWAMPVLYQTVEVDQTKVSRSGMFCVVDGEYYVGLGISVNTKTLEVIAVKDGLIGDWNTSRIAGARVGPGDRISEVNGVRDPDRILRKEMLKRQPMRLLFVRAETLPPPPMEDWVPEPEVNPGSTEISLFVAPANETSVARVTSQPINDAEDDVSVIEVTRLSETEPPRRRIARFRLQWTFATASSLGTAALEGRSSGGWAIRKADVIN